MSTNLILVRAAIALIALFALAASACSSDVADAGPVEPDFPWFAAEDSGVFVRGLTAEEIQAQTGIVVGDIERKTGENLVGPTIAFADGDLLVQLDASMFTFDDVVANNPQASLETMSGYDAVVLGGLGAVIDFPDGPVTVSSFSFGLPTSGVDLARLVAAERAAH